MSWLLYLQWPAGVGLMFYGVMTWSKSLDEVCSPILASLSERISRYSPFYFIIGFFAGALLQGNRSLQYCKRRYIAGFMPTYVMSLTLCGMAIGGFGPAVLIATLATYWSYVILVLGVIMPFVWRSSIGEKIGTALVGFGCCWLGFSFCQSAGVPSGAFSLGLLLGVLLAVITQSPSSVLLVAITLLPAPVWQQWEILVMVTFYAGISWLSLSFLYLRHIQSPFQPALSLLRHADVMFPERALQLVMQENRRMALGIAEVARKVRDAKSQSHGMYFARRYAEDVEQALDESKPSTRRYLLRLARHELNERQAKLLMSLFVGISDLERMSDHLLTVVMSLPMGEGAADIPRSLMNCLDEMLVAVADMMDATVAVLTGSRTRHANAVHQFGTCQERTGDMLDQYTSVLQDVTSHKVLSLQNSIRMNDLRSHMERLIRHARAIVESDISSEVWIDPDLMHEEGKPSLGRFSLARISEGRIKELLEEHTRESE